MTEDIQVAEIAQITDEQYVALANNKSKNAEIAVAKDKAGNNTSVNENGGTSITKNAQVSETESKTESKPATKTDAETTSASTSEPPTETKETALNKEPETKKRKRTLKDKFSIAKEETNPETEKQLNPELEQIKAELQKLKEDPAVKLVLEAKKSNKNLIQALNELRGTSVSSMKDDDIFRQYCRDNGITDEDEIEDELDKFNSQSRLVKKEQLEKIKAQYLQEEENKFGQFFKSEPDPKEVKIIEKFQDDIVRHLKSMNEYGVIKVDDSMRKSIISDLQNNGFIPRLEDGSIDSLKMIDMIMWGRYKKMILDELEKEFTVIGAEIVQDEVEAKPASLVHNKPPDFARKAVTGEEKAKQASESLTYISS